MWSALVKILNIYYNLQLPGCQLFWKEFAKILKGKKPDNVYDCRKNLKIDWKNIKKNNKKKGVYIKIYHIIYMNE